MQSIATRVVNLWQINRGSKPYWLYKYVSYIYIHTRRGSLIHFPCCSGALVVLVCERCTARFGFRMGAENRGRDLLQRSKDTSHVRPVVTLSLCFGEGVFLQSQLPKKSLAFFFGNRRPVPISTKESPGDSLARSAKGFGPFGPTISDWRSSGITFLKPRYSRARRCRWLNVGSPAERSSGKGRV